MASTPLRWRSFLVPKDGHAPDECEDAIAGNADSGRFAIADGAAESYASGLWARLLVEAFTTNGASDHWLAEPRKRWLRGAAGSTMSWYAEEKYAGGGHATFLGVTFQPETNYGSWEAIAAGDACLLVVSQGELMRSFPLLQSSEFSSTPSFVSSLPNTPSWQRCAGVFSAGDCLLLATDALAKCLVDSAEGGSFCGRDLSDMTSDDFAFWVAATRSTGKLRNDDVAFGVIQYEDR